MSRLEEQTTEVMRRLLEVYKDCRYMDKLMGTSFFHESHFQGLLEHVRERGRANFVQRMADHVIYISYFFLAHFYINCSLNFPAI